MTKLAADLEPAGELLCALACGAIRLAPRAVSAGDISPAAAGLAIEHATRAVRCLAIVLAGTVAARARSTRGAVTGGALDATGRAARPAGRDEAAGARQIVRGIPRVDRLPHIRCRAQGVPARSRLAALDDLTALELGGHVPDVSSPYLDGPHEVDALLRRAREPSNPALERALRGCLRGRHIREDRGVDLQHRPIRTDRRRIRPHVRPWRIGHVLRTAPGRDAQEPGHEDRGPQREQVHAPRARSRSASPRSRAHQRRSVVSACASGPRTKHALSSVLPTNPQDRTRERMKSMQRSAAPGIVEATHCAEHVSGDAPLGLSPLPHLPRHVMTDEIRALPRDRR